MPPHRWIAQQSTRKSIYVNDTISLKYSRSRQLSTDRVIAVNANDLVPLRSLIWLPPKLAGQRASKRINTLSDLCGRIRATRHSTRKRVLRRGHRVTSIPVIEHEVTNRDIVRNWRQFAHPTWSAEDHGGDDRDDFWQLFNRVLLTLKGFTGDQTRGCTEE